MRQGCWSRAGRGSSPTVPHDSSVWSRAGSGPGRFVEKYVWGQGSPAILVSLLPGTDASSTFLDFLSLQGSLTMTVPALQRGTEQCGGCGGVSWCPSFLRHCCPCQSLVSSSPLLPPGRTGFPTCLGFSEREESMHRRGISL